MRLLIFFILFLLIGAVIINSMISFPEEKIITKSENNSKINENEEPEELEEIEISPVYNIIPETIQEITENTITFSFSDKNSCIVDGSVFILNKYLGETKNGKIEIEKSKLKNIVKNRDNFTVILRTSIANFSCKDNSIPSWWKTEFGWIVEKSEIENYSEIIFDVTYEIDIRSPKNFYELTNFITPEDVKWFFEKIKHKLSNITFYDLITIKTFLENKITYYFVYGDYWYFPNETLTQGYGDCEEFSTTLTSLFELYKKDYDKTLNCFALFVNGREKYTYHVTTFCKWINNGYKVFGFFDQGEVEIRTNFYKANTEEEKKKRIKTLLYNYLKAYDLSFRSQKVYIAFNETHYFVFSNEDEFYSWAINL